jgi:uncharacterized protein YdaU (DUF1376 family)
MKAPAFQLYAADFYMDTLGWTCEEVGLYFRLLMAEWVNGPLPNDEIRLAKTCQMSAKKFHHNFKNVLPKFVQKGDGYLINQRLEETRLEQQHYQEIQRLKGIKSGESRRKNVNRSSTGVQPKHEPKGNSSSSSSSSLKEEEDAPSQVQDAIKYFCEQTEKVKRFKPQITGKDGASVKRVLGSRSLDRIKAQIDFFLNNEKSEKHITLAAALSADTYNLFMQKSVNQSGKVKYY